MDSYVLFVDTSSSTLLLPVKNFLGGDIHGTNIVGLSFEKAPLSHKITLTVDDETGPNVLLKIGELFHGYTGPVIIFDDIKGVYPVPEIERIAGINNVSCTF